MVPLTLKKEVAALVDIPDRLSSHQSYGYSCTWAHAVLLYIAGPNQVYIQYALLKAFRSSNKKLP